MQRVQPKHRRRRQAPPDRSSQAAQQQKNQNAVDRMQQHAGQVMAPGLQTEQLTVQHVGQHRQRMPVAGHWIEESPFQAFQGQAVLDVNVRDDVEIIIVVEKVMAQRRPVKDGRHQPQQCRHQPHRKSRPAPDRGSGLRRGGFGFCLWPAHRTAPKYQRDGNLGTPILQREQRNFHRIAPATMNY